LTHKDSVKLRKLRKSMLDHKLACGAQVSHQKLKSLPHMQICLGHPSHRCDIELVILNINNIDRKTFIADLKQQQHVIQVEKRWKCTTPARTPE
jgi:hypothetical protein